MILSKNNNKMIITTKVVRKLEEIENHNCIQHSFSMISGEGRDVEHRPAPGPSELVPMVTMGIHLPNPNLLPLV